MRSMILPYVAQNLLCLRDVNLQQMTFNVSVSGLLYLKEKVIFLDVGSMIVFANFLVFHAFKQRDA